MSQYRYLTTSLRTGALLADNLPVVGQSFSRTINAVGSFTGALMLKTGAPPGLVADWVAAVEPWRSVLWVLQDKAPVWCGVITGQPHQSILDGTLPVTAATVEELFKHRQISTTLTFTNADVFDIFRGLASYAVTKSATAAVSGLVLGTGMSGITDTVTYGATDLKKVYDAWTDLVNGTGLEYSIRPAVTDSGALQMVLDLGYPHLGRTADVTSLQFRFPGNQLFDYMWVRTPSAGPANSVVAAAAGPAGANIVSGPSHGQAADELAEGYPLLEDSASLTTLQTPSQALVDAYADGVAAAEKVTAAATPVLKMGADQSPKVSEILLGDGCYFTATSPLHPAEPRTGAPGLQVQARVTSWQLYPPSPQQTEATWFTLGAVAAPGTEG